MASLVPFPKFRAFTPAGDPLDGGKLYTYEAGTNTPKTTYTDSTGDVTNTNPVILNDRGECNLWLGAGLYKLELRDSDDVLQWSEDNVFGNGEAQVQYGLRAHEFTATAGQTLFTISSGYVTGLIQVSVNGAILQSTDYTATDGSTITLAEAADADDEVRVLAFTTFSIPDLEANLANTTSAIYGAGMTGYSPSIEYGATTIGRRLNFELYSDSYDTLQEAITAAAGKTLRITGTHTVSSALTVQSNTEIIFEPNAAIETTTANHSILNCSSCTNVRIYGGRITAAPSAGWSDSASYGHIVFVGATDCIAEGVELEGYQQYGIWMSGATNCHARYCYAHDALGDLQDAAGFAVLNASQDCSVDHCKAVNAGWHGINVQSTSAGLIPLRTKVTNNEINGTTAYGILNYHTADAANSRTLIQGNDVRNVTGAKLSGNSGAGIYLQSTGGVRVIGNVVSNCCTSTSSNSLTPGGIGVNIDASGASLIPPVIDGNTVENIGVTAAGVGNTNVVTLAGIYVVSRAGAVLANNSIHQTTALGASATFAGVAVLVSDRVTIGNHRVFLPTVSGNSQGALVYATGANCSGITFSGFNVTGGTSSGIELTQSGGFTVSSVSINGGVILGGSAACIPLRIANATEVIINGVIASATTVAAMAISASTAVRVIGGSLTTTGTNSVTTSGTCTSGYLDKSTYTGASDSKINNAGTGFRVEQILGTAPAAGTWAVGDTVYEDTPTASNPPAWACTSAGTTFKAYSNLAA